MTAPRPTTGVDRIADAHLDATVALDPIEATGMGVAGHDHRLPDFTPEWWASLSDRRRATLAELDTAEPVDDTDRVTVTALRDALQTAEDLRESGADESKLDVLASPLQSIRQVFDLMPTDTVEHWATVAARLAAVPGSVAGYASSLRWAADRGHLSARRQVAAGSQEATSYAEPDGFFAGLGAREQAGDGTPLPDSLRADLRRAADGAREAYAALGRTLADDLLPRASEVDAIGIDRYPLHSRAFLGAVIDLRETYEWGQAEVAAIEADMRATAHRILPGASVDEAIAHLDGPDGRPRLIGTDALRAWMQQTSDEAVQALADVHFDIPTEIRTLECCIAPTSQGGIYYTGPSEDLTTRPGRMWWSVPEGDTEFATWRERTTVYHEGVPGHHLQVAQTVYRSGTLNRWRRLAAWTSGHGEGWALYAERLMADLGFLDDPADYLGMLDGQSLRAARVVVDIGVHCGFPAPAEVGGGAWTYEKAWTFLRAHTQMTDGMLRFELDRYLGWPGQAPSYKVGERIWLQLRDETRAREGDAFDLKSFHRRALDIGSVGLDALRTALLG